MSTRRGLVVVGGALAQRPGRGGHAWVFLQYLLGFRRLGFDVRFLDRLEPDMCTDQWGRRVPVERSANVAYLAAVMDRFDLADNWSILSDGGSAVVHGTRAEVLGAVKEADLFLNVMGYLDEPALLGAARLPVFLDIDPGFAQHWQALGQAMLVDGHCAYVTVGSNLGKPDCSIPTCGVDWLVTRPPVVLEAWPAARDQGRTFASVASWRGPFDPIDVDGRRLGLRAHSFRPLVTLPALTGLSFELALDIDPADDAERARLEDHGWGLVDPEVVAADPCSYRSYIHSAGAEFGVAKQLYVDTSSGWFSDRSACFLASGKPVLAQDTGFARHLPTGHGLVSFVTLDEAAAGALSIHDDYGAHSSAARELAEEYFDSDRVLTELLDALPA